MNYLTKAGNVFAVNCPSRQILNHLTSKWGVLVMASLLSDTKRFSELKRAIEGINERMLVKTLQDLESDGMVNRKSFDSVPPHVEYSLTQHGKEAASKIAALIDWIELNLNQLITQQKSKT